MLLCQTFISSVSAQELTSGSFLVTDSTTTYGTSIYMISYSFPSRIAQGSNITVSILFTLDSLSGLALYLVNYSLSTTVLGSSPVPIASRTINAPGNGCYPCPLLYPGGHFGPVNITMSLSSSDTGLGPGQQMPANITIGFVSTVWYDPGATAFDSGSKSVGPLTIYGPSQRTNPSVLLALEIVAVAGGLLAVVSILLLTRRSSGVHTTPQARFRGCLLPTS